MGVKHFTQRVLKLGMGRFRIYVFVALALAHTQGIGFMHVTCQQINRVREQKSNSAMTFEILHVKQTIHVYFASHSSIFLAFTTQNRSTRSSLAKK